MKEWEKSGIDSILKKVISHDDDRAEAIANIEAQLIADGLYTEEAKILIKGRQEEWEGCILNMNTEDFIDTVRNIDFAIENISIIDKFKNYLDSQTLQTVFQK